MGHKQIGIAVERARQHGNANEQHAEQNKENGHHDFIQSLNAARYAERHNGQRNGKRCHMVSNAAKWPGDRTEERRHIGLRHQRSARSLDKVLNEPADDHGIANGDAERTQHGNNANNTADFVTVFHAAHFERLRKRAHRARPHGTAERHFANDARNAQHHDEEQIGNQERRAAVLGYAIREQPNARKAHRRANAGNNECGFAAERVSRCSVFGHKGPFLNCNPLTIADFVFKPHVKRTFRWSISARKGTVGQGGTGQSKPRRTKQAPICISRPAFVGASAIFDFPRLGRNAHSCNRKMLPR